MEHELKLQVLGSQIHPANQGLSLKLQEEGVQPEPKLQTNWASESAPRKKPRKKPRVRNRDQGISRLLEHGPVEASHLEWGAQSAPVQARNLGNWLEERPAERRSVRFRTGSLTDTSAEEFSRLHRIGSVSVDIKVRCVFLAVLWGTLDAVRVRARCGNGGVAVPRQPVVSRL